ncbi:MAG TPA: 2Fe-2S iron-sulfur cluster-binding protein [Pseudomonadales bacterium]
MVASITYITADGAERRIDAANGISLMQLALANAIPGIIGECGGVMSCATCHLYVDAAWYDRLAPPQKSELDMLEFADDPTALSRLGCQIKVRDDLNGLIVRVPRA